MNLQSQCQCGIAIIDCEYHQKGYKPMPTDIQKELMAINETFAKVCKGLEAAGVPELLHHIQEIDRLRPPHRLPLAFIGNPENGSYNGSVQPSVSCKPMHLVLSEATAEAYDIYWLQVANINSNIGIDPLPGDLFTVKFYQKSPELLDAMAFDIAWITPANRVTICAKLKQGAVPTQFRGIVWCGGKGW